jgi:hypothetical protein
MKKHIKIFDTTLRDGEQAPGFSMKKRKASSGTATGKNGCRCY